MGRRSKRCRCRCLISLADALFMVTKRGDHPAFCVEKKEICIAAEQFCEERDGSVPAGEIKANDAIAGHVLNAVDPRALNARPEQLTEGGRGRRIGQRLLNEVDTRRVVSQGVEQAAGMSRHTNFQDQGVGQRLKNLLYPAVCQGLG